MPGKINPSVPEMVNQVCFHVIGNDTAIAYATQAGQLELNVMMPMVAHNLLEAMQVLANALVVLDRRCVRELAADEARCRAYALGSVAIATVLNPLVGYKRAAEVVKQALREDRPVVEIAVEKGYLTAEEAAVAFSPERLTTPRDPDAR
jgi:aspartate ammonia-lyase